MTCFFLEAINLFDRLKKILCIVIFRFYEEKVLQPLKP